MVILEGDLERTSKYIKKWAKRFVSFDDSTRKISYGLEKDKIKGTMLVTKITRIAEMQPIRPNSGDLYAVHIEGALEDGKPDAWTIRMPTLEKYTQWCSTIRNCLSAQGLMEATDFGLPLEDPRNGLPFVNVPVEHLHKFALLEKAIVYYFGHVTMHGYESHVSPQEHIVMVGDRNVYVFRPNADVLRCVPIESITSLRGPTEPGSHDAFAVIGVQPSEHDIVLRSSNELGKILNIINEVYKGTKGSSIPIENTTPPDVPFTGLEAWCEGKGIKLRPLEGYKMKAMSPTPKAKLKVALDMYQQQHGSSYSRTATKRSKTDKAAAMATAAAATAAAGSSSPGSSRAPSMEADGVDDSLSRLLKRSGFQQYTAVLRKQHVDVELLTCMDVTDLVNFGVKDQNHCEAILKAAQEREANGSPSEQSLEPPATTTGSASTSGGGVPPAAAPAPSVVSPPMSPASPAAKKMIITLDSDDEDLMPVVGGNTASFNTSVGASGLSSPHSNEKSVVVLDDSDDDLVVAPPPAKPPAPTINLDDDDI